MILCLVEINDAAAVHIDLLKFPSPILGNSSRRNSRNVVVSSADQLAAFLQDFGYNEWPDEVDLSDMTS